MNAETTFLAGSAVRPRPVSSPAPAALLRDSLTVQVESFREVRHELETLFPAHHAEVEQYGSDFPLDFDFVAYHTFEDQGQLLTVTLRNADGKLVGYLLALVLPDLHSKNRSFMTVTLFYVDASARCRLGGKRLFRAAEQYAKERGLTRLLAGSRVFKDSSRLFEALGYKEFERYYSIRIGD